MSARVSADSLSVCEGVCRHYDVRSRRQSADTMVGISQTLKTVNAYMQPIDLHISNLPMKIGHKLVDRISKKCFEVDLLIFIIS